MSKSKNGSSCSKSASRLDGGDCWKQRLLDSRSQAALLSHGDRRDDDNGDSNDDKSCKNSQSGGIRESVDDESDSCHGGDENAIVDSGDEDEHDERNNNNSGNDADEHDGGEEEEGGGHNNGDDEHDENREQENQPAENENNIDWVEDDAGRILFDDQMPEEVDAMDVEELLRPEGVAVPESDQHLQHLADFYHSVMFS